MNHMDETEMDRSISKHRKISTSFRDTTLLEIFTIACNLLKQANSNIKGLNMNDQTQHDLIGYLLQLSLNCLLYDFLGTLNEDTSDDMTTVQIPNTWRSIIMDFTNIEIYFNLYHNLPGDLAAQSLACLVQISALRRSFFNNNERMNFLKELINGVKKILDSPRGLEDPKCYHEFCRLLARLKCNYQLSELVKVEGYSDLIKSIANFTITSLRMPHFSSNSLYYLLSLWQRMVSSVPYVKTQEPHNLETYTPDITKSYITSRLELVNSVVRDGLEDPFDDLASIYQQLEQISIIGRCDYEKTCTTLVQLFDQTATQYQSLFQSNSNSNELRIKEDQLTWLVYIIGGVIGGRLSYNTGITEEHDLFDGELVVRVVQLMEFLSNRQDQDGFACEKLDLAMLNFFEQFRKIFIGDQVQKASKVYKRMSEVLGIADENMWLNLMMRKMYFYL
jgi:exportin-7